MRKYISCLVLLNILSMTIYSGKIIRNQLATCSGFQVPIILLLFINKYIIIYITFDLIRFNKRNFPTAIFIQV